MSLIDRDSTLQEVDLTKFDEGVWTKVTFEDPNVKAHITVVHHLERSPTDDIVTTQMRSGLVRLYFASECHGLTLLRVKSWQSGLRANGTNP